MDPLDSFAALTQRLRAGEQDAAAEVVRRFTARLIARARAELDARIRAKVDPEDVVQSAYRSFFTRYDAGRFDCATWDELWSLLTVITLRKCLNRRTYFHAQCRDIAGEVGVGARRGDRDDLGQAIDREPTPLQAAILAETVEQLLRGMDPDDRVIVELSLQGYSAHEIGAQLGHSERTVRRVRERTKGRLRRMQEHDRAG